MNRDLKHFIIVVFALLAVYLMPAMGETCGPYTPGAFYCPSPNMGLSIPTVGVETGPGYAYDVNNALNLIDGHNHTPGYGVQVPTAGININADLPFSGYNATTLRSCRFSAQSLFTSSSDNGSLFESGVDLYYRDGNGNNIRLTQSGTNALTFPSQSANFVYSGPSSGPNAAPSFRALVATDIPTITNSKLATMAANTIKGNNTGGSAAPSDLTVAQVAAMFTAPTVSVVTATSHSGGFSANSSGTYTTPANVKYIRVRMVGGGGGGSGSGTASSSSNGSAGGNTTFGTTLLVANGGSGGAWSGSSGGVGGTASLGTGPVGVAITGATGQGAAYQNIATIDLAGSQAGSSFFGGAGQGGGASAGGGAAAANSGSGGGGAGNTGVANCFSGSGGGAGGYVDAVITSPSASFAFSIGSAGPGGSAGTSGFTGGSGAAGIIIVDEFYQ